MLDISGLDVLSLGYWYSC